MFVFSFLDERAHQMVNCQNSQDKRPPYHALNTADTGKWIQYLHDYMPTFAELKLQKVDPVLVLCLDGVPGCGQALNQRRVCLLSYAVTCDTLYSKQTPRKREALARCCLGDGPSPLMLAQH